MLINKCLDKNRQTSHLDQATLLFRDSGERSMSPSLLLLPLPLLFSLSFALLPSLTLCLCDMWLLEQG